MSGVVHHAYEDGHLVLDERYFPVIIATWSGTQTLEGITRYYEWCDRMLRRAADEGVRLLSISDALDVGRVRSGIRSRHTEEASLRAESIRDHVDFVMVVARRAYLLGIIASIVVRMRWGIRLSSFGDIAPAIERALLRLDVAGVPRPAGLDPATYERPSYTRAVA